MKCYLNNHIFKTIISFKISIRSIVYDTIYYIFDYLCTVIKNKMSHTIQFSEIGTSLGTRDLAAKIRVSIEQEVKKNDKIFLDFKDVEVVTNSFANECFGKLREAISTEIFRKKIAFINTNDFIQRVIISAL